MHDDGKITKAEYKRMARPVIVSSLIGVAQQQISMRYFKKKDQKETEAIEVMPIEVNVTRRVQKKRQTKKR